MDIEIGISPPILQKPYNLSLKHTAWKHWKKQELLSEVFLPPRASPIVVVPK